MERLTYELSYKGSGEYDTDNTKNMPINMYVQVINKLGKLEDLEEQIGCPLDVLFRALKDGIYQKDLRDSVKHRANLQWWKEENAFILQTYSCDEYTKDYKKTWWLKSDKSE